MGGIADVYRTTKKTPDLVWNTYVCRPPAAALVYALRATRITPNQITLLAFVVAFVSALLFVVAPGYWGVLGAALVFEASYVLDCADGMLARLRSVQSVRGHLLDFLMDEIKAFLILGAVAVRLYLGSREVSFLLLGIAGLIALASGIALTTFLRRPEIAAASSANTWSASAAGAQVTGARRLIAGVERVAKFLIHYPSYILFAAMSGHLELYLYPYVAVNAAYAARAWLSVALRFGRV
jgi:phosphatidylglycerophosphate synthase